MRLRDAIQNVLLEADQMAKEEVEVGGGATGVSMVPDTATQKAQAPGKSNQSNGMPMQKVTTDGVTDTEETDEENNVAPTGDMSAKNRASISMKGSVKEHFDAMFEGEELSEDFKEKATTIFEMAVNYRVNEITEELEQLYQTRLNEELENVQQQFAEEVEDLTVKLDQYLNYVIEQWLDKNEIAIENSIRTEITEDFIEGLKNLFAEHYIDIPDDKVDVVEQLALRVEELENNVIETLNENIELKNKLTEMQHNELVDEISEGLTLSQAEKFKSLVEGLQFENVDDFKKKLSIVKENYFPSNVSKKTSSLLEESFEGEEPAAVTSPEMSKYVSAISRTTIR